MGVGTVTIKQLQFEISSTLFVKVSPLEDFNSVSQTSNVKSWLFSN